MVLATCLVVGWFVLLPEQYANLGKHVAAGAGFVSNIVLWSEVGYFDGSSEQKLLLHLWSLAIEEQFYIVWPIALLCTARIKWAWPYVVLTVVALSFGFSLKSVNSDPAAAFYSPATRVWELLVGAVVAVFARRTGNIYIDEPWRPSALSAFGTVLLGIAIFGLNSRSAFPGAAALLPTLGAALVIYSGPTAWINRALFSRRPAVWVGLISYPLYLWHWPLLAFPKVISSGMASVFERGFALVLSILLAWMTYRFIEVPLRHGNFLRIKTISLGVLMVTLAAAGLTIKSSNGYGFRFTEIEQNLSNFKYDFENDYRGHTCFLYPEQAYTEFSRCQDPSNGSKQILLLWGDSHAAHLYPGYKKYQSSSFNIIQRNSSICPPILGVNTNLPAGAKNLNCRDINAFVMRQAKEIKPDKVVLAARWGVYDWRGVAETIHNLKELGINNIDLIGPAPLWIDTLPKQLHQFFKQSALRSIPKRMSYGLNGEFYKLDKEMREFSKSLSINYISLSDILCNHSGCMTLLDDNVESITQWDEAHLTSSGSEFVVSHFYGDNGMSR